MCADTNSNPTDPSEVHVLSRTLVHRVSLPVAVLLALAACSGDDSAGPTTAPSAPPTADINPVVAGEPFPDDRCEANRAAGTISYYSGFDFAATASIVEVLVAKERGYFDELCLDVELRSSFSTQNYPFVAANTAQFASGGSFSEIVDFADKNAADFVAVAVEGKTPIDALIVKPGQAETLEDLRGTTIGVKGKLPAGVEVMLLEAGLVEGTDYVTVPIEGFDPTAHIAIDAIDAFPGWKSNEPGRLARQGIEFVLFDPTTYDVPGSFGAIFTTRDFIERHPTAAEDFVRATLQGLAAAIEDPEAAAGAAVELVVANGNPNFLSPEGEVFRWGTEAQLIADRTPAGSAPGTPDPAALAVEVATYASVDFFGAGDTPDAARHVDASLAARVTRPDGSIIWPAR